MKKILLVSFILLQSFSYFVLDDPPTFGPKTNKGVISNDDIDEASGLAVGINNQGVLWTHNDSGGENRIFAFDTNGVSVGTYYLQGVENRDWEDICIGPGPDENLHYIYIGDVGDNDGDYKEKFIYRIVEPTIGERFNFVDTISEVSKITFTYPDNDRDAETIFLDPLSKDLYIVGKRDTKVRLYKLSFPQSTTETFEAELAVKFTLPNDPESDTPNNYITGGDISFDGNEILLKSYQNIYYWNRVDGESISETISNEPAILAYETEPQGEAICWKNDSENGYYTLSEEKVTFNDITFNFPAQLYYYPRKSNVTGIEKKRTPNRFILKQNYPNPFNPTTTISYQLLEDQEVSLTVYNNQGKVISVLVDKKQNSGIYNSVFDAKDLPSGIYYYKLILQNYSNTKKMLLLK